MRLLLTAHWANRQPPLPFWHSLISDEYGEHVHMQVYTVLDTDSWCNRNKDRLCMKQNLKIHVLNGIAAWTELHEGNNNMILSVTLHATTLHTCMCVVEPALLLKLSTHF